MQLYFEDEYDNKSTIPHRTTVKSYSFEQNLLTKMWHEANVLIRIEPVIIHNWSNVLGNFVNELFFFNNKN